MNDYKMKYQDRGNTSFGLEVLSRLRNGFRKSELLSQNFNIPNCRKATSLFILTFLLAIKQHVKQMGVYS